ncbi:hypothetical protein JW872_02715 [Candidatus Babeliales bacterium]|nr:hypothetical protein [Candidatus Babeliales bacterium]
MLLVVLFIGVCTTLTLAMWRSYGALAQQWRYRLQHEQRILLSEGLARAGCAMIRAHKNIDEPVVFRSWPPGDAHYSGKIMCDYHGDQVTVCAQLLEQGVHCGRVSCVLARNDDKWVITSWSAS